MPDATLLLLSPPLFPWWLGLMIVVAIVIVAVSSFRGLLCDDGGGRSLSSLWFPHRTHSLTVDVSKSKKKEAKKVAPL
jgi:hypothetical protein